MPSKPLPTAFPDLVATHTSFLLRWALKLTNNQEDAEDLAQDTIIKALVGEDKFTPDSNLKAWLAMICKNTFITNYQRKRKRGTHLDLEEMQDRGSLSNSCPNEGVGEIHKQEIEIALSEVSSPYQAILRRRSEGYKYDELAIEFDMPVGTIKNKIHVGRAELTQRLNRTKKTILT